MGQIDDLVGEINERVEKDQRVFVTTLTKKMAEDLTDYFKELGIKVKYLHSDIKTLERTEIIRDLRLGEFDVLVGINLLREGLDVPEVSLVAILDADKEGFLRSERSLVQTIGRAARNEEGKVIMYADKVTDSMRLAMDETSRRRTIQQKYNEEHGIVPKTIIKEIRDLISITKESEDDTKEAVQVSYEEMTKEEKDTLLMKLEKEMKDSSRLFGKVIVPPGSALAYHTHECEGEAYHILQGKGLYNDNGTKYEVHPGDTTFTCDGAGHAIENIGDEDLVFMALILLDK